jgi:ankyrin repeat protein
VSARDDEALRRAAANGHLETVEYLVESGANVSARDNEALWMATRNGHRDVVEYLIAVGANPRVLGY